MLSKANRQAQKAGEYSNQIQASTINVYNGIDEKRAREIIDERLQDVLACYSQEAHEIAQSRIQQFADELIPKLVQQNVLEKLKEPSIQILLTDAQKAAASTERTDDYALLAELLMHRIEKGNDYNIRAGVAHAVKIVDEISDNALLGLTVLYCMENLFPVLGYIQGGLSVLEDMYSKIVYRDLPTDNLWLDQLDILGTVRLSYFLSKKTTKDLFVKHLSGYIDPGIRKGTDNHEKAKSILTNAGLPEDLLFEHELNDEYVRLQIANLSQLDILHYIQPIRYLQPDDTEIIDLSPASLTTNDLQRKAIKDIYALYVQDENVRNNNISKFEMMLANYPMLTKICEWRDHISEYIGFTYIGKVLAHVNAQRYYRGIPDLILK